MATSQSRSPLNRYLHALGIPELRLKMSGSYHHCPMHPDSPASLQAVPNPLFPGEYHLRCNWPRCTFKSGSAVDLVMHKLGLSTYDALRMFGPGGKLDDTLIATGADPKTAADVISMMYSDIERQTEIREYLNKSYAALRGDNSRMGSVSNQVGIRPVMVEKLPMGVVVHPVLDWLPKMKLPKVRQNQYLLFPYSSGGLLAGMSIYCSANNDYEMMDLASQDARIGIFMEDLLEWPIKSLVVCLDERDAIALRSRVDEINSSTKVNIVCLQSTKALEYLVDLQVVTLFTHKDRQLTIECALGYARLHRNVQVFQPPSDSILSVTGNQIVTLDNHSIPVWQWVSSRLIELYHAEGVDTVYQVLSAGAILDSDKDRLLETLGSRNGVPEPLLHTVKRVVCSTSTRTLGNLEIKKTASGYWETRPCYHKLTNFTLNIYRNTVNNYKKRVLCARLKPDRTDLPTIQVELLASRLNKPAYAVSEYIWELTSEQGLDFKPFVAHPSGNSARLLQVATLFGQGDISGAPRSLGVHQATIEYPHVSIDTALRHSSICSIPDGYYRDVLQTYGAIDNIESTDLPAMQELLSATDDTTRSFNLMLGHVLHQTAVTAAHNGVYHLHNLVLPSRWGKHSHWLSVVRQLVMAFSGSQIVPEVPTSASSASKWLRKHLSLTNLPLICQSLNQPDAVSALVNFELPLVCVMDSNAAASFNNVPGTSYLVDDVTLFDVDSTPRQLPTQLIEAVRANWVPALLGACTQYRDLPEFRSSDLLPAEDGYRMMCATFEVTPVDMSDLTSTTYTKEMVNTPEVFLAEIAYVLASGRKTLMGTPSQLHHRKGPGANDVLGCRTPEGDTLLLKCRALNSLNRTIDGWFSIKQLDTELAERGMLADQCSTITTAHWVIPAKVWQKFSGRLIDPESKLRLVKTA